MNICTQYLGVPREVMKFKIFFHNFFKFLKNMVIIIIMTKITKKHTNIMTFQQKCTNFRNFYLVKKGPKNLGIGNPPPLSGNAWK